MASSLFPSYSDNRTFLFCAARELREHNLISKIIFLTTSPEFAIESYDVDASGYLLKPVDREKLYKLLDKCLSAVSKPADSIAVHTAFGYQNVLMHHIEFLEAQNKKVLLALYDGKRLEAIGKLSDYEKLLTVEKGFFKCHRSYIVYMPAEKHFSHCAACSRFPLQTAPALSA